MLRNRQAAVEARALNQDVEALASVFWDVLGEFNFEMVFVVIVNEFSRYCQKMVLEQNVDIERNLDSLHEHLRRLLVDSTTTDHRLEEDRSTDRVQLLAQDVLSVLLLELVDSPLSRDRSSDG